MIREIMGGPTFPVDPFKCSRMMNSVNQYQHNCVLAKGPRAICKNLISASLNKKEKVLGEPARQERYPTVRLHDRVCTYETPPKTSSGRAAAQKENAKRKVSDYFLKARNLNANSVHSAHLHYSVCVLLDSGPSQ